MRRLYPPLAAGLVALVLAGLWAGGSSGRARTPAVFDSSKNPACKVLGVGSCASMACHGANGPKGSKGSEYSTFIAVDPHARAYQTLYKPESKGMHTKLAQAFPGLARFKDAAHNPVCLDCHGMGGREPERFQADGAGCERCHGPAATWVSTHYLDEFRPRLDRCFNDLRNDPVVRPYVCTKCHVGDADQEVNHVLIAAGHPRLRFEYGAYYANYSTTYRHWVDLGEKDVEPTFGARSWVLGQLVSARAALELLVSRAGDEKKRSNWPEFAEYDCTACHHDLSSPSQRQKRSLRLAGPGHRAGDLPWGTWYYPLLATLARHVPGAPRELLPSLAKLDRLMRLRLPPPGAVVNQARRSIALLDGWIEAVRKDRFGEARLVALTRDLAGQVDLVQSGWDGGSQVYLGLAALHQARGDANPRFKQAAPLREPLNAIRKGLKYSFEPGARTLYDTPNDYDRRVDAILRALNVIRRSE
jgi:hypothetical protein